MSAACKCGRVWSGLAEAHCGACHGHFGSGWAFDAHRVGDVNIESGPKRRRCADPAELHRKDGNPVLVPTERKSGTVWVGWRPEGAFREYQLDPEPPAVLAGTSVPHGSEA